MQRVSCVICPAVSVTHVRDCCRAQVDDAPEDVEFAVQVGMVEIYQERIRDLLEPTHDSLSIHSKKDGSL